MSNSTGRLFVVTTFGESHGAALGAVIDGCLPHIPLTEADIQPQLDRRRPGQSALASPRKEPDRVEILSGVDRGVTLGTPICMVVRNTDARPSDYESLGNVPRPSHADLAWRLKYGVAAASGGGRASARETVARVAAGAVARKLLEHVAGIRIVAWVSGVGAIQAPDMTGDGVTCEDVDSTAVRCPDPGSARRMTAEIMRVRKAGDSTGGIVTCVCSGIPEGWGEPVFGKLSAELGGAMLSIPAAKGIEIGSGFCGTRMRGSKHNDLFIRKGKRIGTASNRSGGIQGGITNGEPVVFRVAFKPPATVSLPQRTVGYDGKPATIRAGGRHDPCVVPRAVPVVEAMAAIVLADACLLARAFNEQARHV